MIAIVPFCGCAPSESARGLAHSSASARTTSESAGKAAIVVALHEAAFCPGNPEYGIAAGDWYIDIHSPDGSGTTESGLPRENVTIFRIAPLPPKDSIMSGLLHVVSIVHLRPTQPFASPLKSLPSVKRRERRRLCAKESG